MRSKSGFEYFCTLDFKHENGSSHIELERL